MADEESKAAEESSFLQPSAVSGSEHEVEPAVSPYEDVREGDAEGTIGEDEEEVSSETPKTTLRSLHKYSAGEAIHPLLPGVPVIVTCSANSERRGRRLPLFKLVLEHGPFTWTVNKNYRECLSLRRDLAPLRLRIRVGRIGRGRHHGYLPHLLSFEDMNPREESRLRNQLPKVQRFMNAVLNDRELRTHPSTMKFLEVSRISFVEDLGTKKKEGFITKSSGGHRRVTNCLGCTACCVCRWSVWRQRWFVLKDSFLAYIRSDWRTIAGVLLFDEGMTVEWGVRLTKLQNGLSITTLARELLVKCPSQNAMRGWRDALQEVMSNAGKIWVEKKRFDSFAPLRKHCTATWFVDGESYMAAVANALLAAKDEIFITDWMMSPHILLKREEANSLHWRLDKILLKKADEGVRVYIQLYKEIQLAIDLGSEFTLRTLNHHNIVAQRATVVEVKVFRHPEHIQTGVYLWAHHEKIVVIDQTLAFVGGIDLCFGRWDNACHKLHDQGSASHLTESSVMAFDPLESVDDPGVMHQKWQGKDYYNPFIKDFIALHKPLDDQLDRNNNARMPWHDIASCMYGKPARDVARHFIQRYNFTKREQAHEQGISFLLPRQEFTEKELEGTQYLRDLLQSPASTDANVQILRSVSEWSAGVRTETSIHTAYLNAIKDAEHFIYIENQFFISSLGDVVSNGIADALRQRIVRAFKENKTFRVIIVMPLLPSFGGEFGERSGTILEAVIHWNYRSLARGEDSLIGKLIHTDGIPETEVDKYISVYGLRTYGILNDKPISEIVYVHSKCMIVDDRLTIIGSANVNDRSMLGERDSEVAVIVEDNEMVESHMNGEVYQVGQFSHCLRSHIFKEHLGLPEECHGNERPEISIQDPACDQFYLETWMKAANNNTEIYEEVFGGKLLPSDKVFTYEQLRNYRNNPGVVGHDIERAKKMLAQTQGVLVNMPLQFLRNENLLPDVGTKESLAPNQLVT